MVSTLVFDTGVRGSIPRRTYDLNVFKLFFCIIIINLICKYIIIFFLNIYFIMSWVIARHLCKSGNNNIRFRIGQFNKWSSPKAMCKKRSTELLNSCLVERFQKKKKNMCI